MTITCPICSAPLEVELWDTDEERPPPWKTIWLRWSDDAVLHLKAHDS